VTSLAWLESFGSRCPSRAERKPRIFLHGFSRNRETVLMHTWYNPWHLQVALRSRRIRTRKRKREYLDAARRRKVQNLLLLCRITVDKRDRHATKKKQYYVTIVYVLGAVPKGPVIEREMIICQKRRNAWDEGWVRNWGEREREREKERERERLYIKINIYIYKYINI